MWHQGSILSGDMPYEIPPSTNKYQQLFHLQTPEPDVPGKDQQSHGDHSAVPPEAKSQKNYPSWMGKFPRLKNRSNYHTNRRWLSTKLITLEQFISTWKRYRCTICQNCSSLRAPQERSQFWIKIVDVTHISPLLKKSNYLTRRRWLDAETSPYSRPVRHS